MRSIVWIQFVFLAFAVAQEQAVAKQYGFLMFPFPVNTMPPNPVDPCLLRGRLHAKRDDYTYVQGIGGYKLHTRALPWTEARLICEEEGAHLAIINSVAESDAIALFYQRSKPIVGSPLPQYAAVGFHDLYSEGQYVTIHGESLSQAGFDQWGGVEPNNLYNGLDEDCGSVDKDGKLNDISCKTPIGFICEVPV